MSMTRRSLLGGLAGLSVQGTPAAAQVGPVAALAIGVSNYADGRALPSANRDARLLAATFLQLGFDAEYVGNPSQSDILHALARLRLRASASALVVIYVAGHGVMQGGETRIFATDTPISQGLHGNAIPESVLVSSISDKPRQKVLFLDTCRDVPGLTGIRGQTCHDVAGGLLAGTHVCYATQPGASTFDGDRGYSPFAHALRTNLMIPGQEISAVSLGVRSEVVRATSGLQVPWDRSSLLAPVILNRGL